MESSSGIENETDMNGEAMVEWAKCESQLKVITLLLVIYKIISNL